jgi:hypothetical protein
MSSRGLRIGLKISPSRKKHSSFWGAHAPRVHVSAASPKHSAHSSARELQTFLKFATTRRRRQHARARALPGSETFRCFDDVLGVDAAFFHHFGAGRAETELVETDYFAVQAHVLIPDVGHARFDGHAFPA